MAYDLTLREMFGKKTMCKCPKCDKLHLGAAKHQVKPHRHPRVHLFSQPLRGLFNFIHPHLLTHQS